MTRVRAESLALVNWKGVFFEHYRLDRHVTGLEGDNGAGKTTAMIGAYVVMMPDLTRLRFTNLGETGATGGDRGIWGRLGEPGRPTYALLALRVAREERLLAGVHIERKGEPSLDFTPFVIEGLADDVALDSLLLLRSGETEEVPELAQLRANVGRLGGRLRAFPSVKEYFAALFEHGVTPMKLATDEERGKLNDMLRTSMTGGMSRNLLGDLRSFLLPRATHLADTLHRMRSNLDACRRTRAHVLESRQLETELRSVAEAGEAMVASYLVATRRRAEELSRVADEAAEQHRADEAVARDLERRVTNAERAHEEGLARRTAAADAARTATAWVTRVEDAVAWADRLASAAVSLASASADHEEAVRRRDAAQADAEAAAHALERAQQLRERAADGVGAQQRGVDLLIRRAAEHDAVTQRWATARTLLDQPELAIDDATTNLSAAETEITTVDAQRHALARRLADAERHRRDHGLAMEALAAIDASVTAAAATEASATAADAHGTARAALARVARWRERADRGGRLEAELRTARADAERQDRARARARALDLPTAFDGSAVDVVRRELEAVDTALAGYADGAHAADAAASAARQAGTQARAEVIALEARTVAYTSLATIAARLEAVLEAPVRDGDGLAAARQALSDREGVVAAEVRALIERRGQLRDDARQLRDLGGRFPASLLQLRDTLGAELLATRFDETTPEEAGPLEAWIGHLASALVVPDVERASEANAADALSPGTVWLVGEDAPIGFGAPVVVSGVVRVDGDGVRRVTRVPARPTLGSAARERLAREQDREADDLDEAVTTSRESAHELARLRSDADALLVGATVWSLGDPGAELDEARRRGGDAEGAARDARDAAEAARAAARGLEPRRSALQQLLPDASLLGGPDAHERLAQLQATRTDAGRAMNDLARVRDAPDRLEHLLDALVHRPWSPAAETTARADLTGLDERRDTLTAAIEGLRYVLDHRVALTWTDARAFLEHDRALMPALQAQLADAVRAVAAAKGRDEDARGARDAAVTTAAAAFGALESAQRSHAEAEERLAQLGVAEPTAAALAEAEAQASAAEAAHAAADEALMALVAERERLRAAWAVARSDLDTSATHEEEARDAARLARDAWTVLEGRMHTEGWLAAAALDRHERALPDRAAMLLFEAARVERARLVERLASVRDAADARAEVERTTTVTPEGAAAAAIRAWLAVRAWLRQRLPAQIAQGDDLDASMRRFGDHLGDLVASLEQHEHDLRGSSSDVANAVEVHIRKANTRVQRLNGHLRKVAFGSVGQLRVRLERIERMSAVLRALQSGRAQGLLFESDLPIEEAMRRVMEEHAKVRFGADGVLDYREYLELKVEIRRRGHDGWEEANPTRLSTGEAIGVGAALMMVVLTEWEQDANLLRGRRGLGSLRLLLLDEANRLDATNLVLTCRSSC